MAMTNESVLEVTNDNQQDAQRIVLQLFKYRRGLLVTSTFRSVYDPTYVNQREEAN